MCQLGADLLDNAQGVLFVQPTHGGGVTDLGDL